MSINHPNIRRKIEKYTVATRKRPTYRFLQKILHNDTYFVDKLGLYKSYYITVLRYLQKILRNDSYVSDKFGLFNDITRYSNRWSCLFNLSTFHILFPFLWTLQMSSLFFSLFLWALHETTYYFFRSFSALSADRYTIFQVFSRFSIDQRYLARARSNLGQTEVNP